MVPNDLIGLGGAQGPVQVSPGEQARRHAMTEELQNKKLAIMKKRRRALLFYTTLIYLSWPLGVMWAWNALSPFDRLTVPFTFTSYAALLVLLVAYRVAKHVPR